MCVGVVSSRLGANLPCDSAPPAPPALWHNAQLVRNRAIPEAGSPRAGSTISSVGTDGPGPSAATKAASWLICSSVNWTGLACAWGPFIAIGMRPVPTWKSTAAAPTPIRDGAFSVPDAAGPWQVEQLAWNSFSPVATSSAVAVFVAASADEGATTAYTAPTSSSASSRSSAGARRSCLRAASAFTDRSSSRMVGMGRGMPLSAAGR